MEPVHLQDDLKGEVALVVCEWPEEKVLTLHQAGRLEFYVVRVILNMLTNKYSPFYKKFRNINVLYTERISNINGVATYEGDEARFDFSDLNKKLDNIVREQGQDLVDFTERERKETTEDWVLKEIDRLYWYDAELLRIYLRVGNFRAMEAETGIPYTSCYNNVKKSMAILKQKAEAARPLFLKKELSFIQNNCV